MKVVFFGTPQTVIPIVKMLHKQLNAGKYQNFIAVVTQPPRPSGRGKRLSYSPVDNWAHKQKIPVVYHFDEVPEADLGVVAAYGRIIPETVISKFKLGILNVHPSLLPEFRGASPVQAAILTGKRETGVSVIKMDSEMDHGPIVSQFKEEILDEDTSELLIARLFEKSAEFLQELIPNYTSGKVKLKPQVHEQASFTTPISKGDGFIPGKIIDALLRGLNVKQELKINFIRDYKITSSAYNIDRFIKAMTPWPTVWTYVRPNSNLSSKRLKILKAHVLEGKLVLDEVQLEGKKPVSWEQFKRGYPGFEFTD